MPNYSIDASAILDAWARHYPHDLFPTFWDRFEGLAKAGDSIATELIAQELSRKDDGCHAWFQNKGLHYFFVELNDDIQNAVSTILENPNYQRLVEDRKGTFGADPFVIALAQVYDLTVVTGEKHSHNIEKPKIPDVCDELNIDCINILDLIRKEGWQF